MTRVSITERFERTPFLSSTPARRLRRGPQASDQRILCLPPFPLTHQRDRPCPGTVNLGLVPAILIATSKSTHAFRTCWPSSSIETVKLSPSSMTATKARARDDVAGPVVYLDSLQQDTAGTRRRQAGNGTDGRRLPHSVSAHEGHNLPGPTSRLMPNRTWLLP